MNGISTSRIDLVVHPTQQSDTVHSISVDYRNPVNTSTHNAVIATLNSSPPTTPVTKREERTGRSIPRRIKWHKLDLVKYKQLTGEKCAIMLDHLDPDLPIEVDIQRLNNALTSAAAECSPASRPAGKPKHFKWSPLLKPLVAETKECFHTWKQAGRPPAGTPCSDDMKQAKKRLRSMQKSIDAEERNQRHAQIMMASETDQDLFYKLVRQQRGDGQDTHAVINFKSDPNNNLSQIDNWANYFEDLATPKDLPQFSKDAKASSSLRHQLLQLLAPKGQAMTIEPTMVCKHVAALKNNKAPDPFGVAAEHLKHAHPNITPLLTSILNRILQSQNIPDDLKLGLITPVQKKQKSKQNPDHYRRITVNSMIGKLVEKEMVPHTRTALKPKREGFMHKCWSHVD